MKIVKKVLLMALSFVLVAAISVGATLAFLADTDSDVNVMTVGNVKIDQVEYERSDVEATVDAAIREFTQAKPLDPAVYAYGYDFTDTVAVKLPALGVTVNLWDDISNEQDKFVFVKNTGVNKAYLRTWFAFELGTLSLTDWQNLFHVNANTADWDWTTVGTAKIGGVQHAVVYATYKTALAAGALAAPSLLQYAMDEKAGNETVASFNGSYDILVFSQAVQTTGFDSANAAFAKAFGVNMPWKGTMNGTTVNGSSVQFPTTAAELQAALDNAVPGTTICLAAGVDYGTVELRPVAGNANTVTDCDYLVYRNEMLRKVENLTIIGAPGATLDAIEIVAGHIEGSTGYTVDIQNLVIDSVEFNDTHTNAPHSYASPLFIDLTYTNVDGLTVKNCKLIGNNDKLNFVYIYGSGNPANSTFATASKNITITGNTVDGIARLCELRQTENVTITDNTINNTALHGILLPVDNGTYSGNVVIVGNTANFINERFVRMAGAGTANVVITDNTINGYLGADEDFIKVTDATGVVTVENNNITLGASTVADLKAALAAGGNVILTEDVTAPLSGSAIYGTPVAVVQKNGGVIDGNGHSLIIDNPQYNGYAIETYGGTIKNLVIDTTVGRGIVISTPKEDVYIDNVVIDGPGYALNTTEYNGKKLIVTNSTVKGWTSFAGLDIALFTNCNFGENTSKYWQNSGYSQDYDRLIRPYVTAEFTDCVFEKGYYIDLSGLGAACTITLDNCTVNGVVITEANYADLITIELPSGRTLSSCVIFK